MAITVDIGPGGRKLLRAASGKPVLGFDHKYVKEIFGDLLADVETTGSNDEITQVKYSLVRHGRDMLTQESPVLGRSGGIGSSDLERLKKAYEELDRVRNNAPDKQVREILSNFHPPSRIEDPFAFRTYKDPVDGSKRLVILWGTVPGTAMESDTFIPVDPDEKRDEEMSFLIGLAGIKARISQTPWMRYTLWGVAALAAFLILLFFIKAMMGNPDEELRDRPLEDIGHAQSDSSYLIVLEEEADDRGFFEKMKDEIVVFVTGKEDTAEVKRDPEPAIVQSDTSDVAGRGSGMDNPDEPQDSGDQGEPGDSGQAGDPGDLNPDPASGEEPGLPDDLEGAIYIFLNDDTASEAVSIARVTLEEPLAIVYYSQGEVDNDMVQQAARTEIGTRLRPGASVTTIWVPVDEYMLGQVDSGSLIGVKAPRRNPEVSSYDQEAFFFRLTLDEHGRLVSKSLICLEGWNK